MDVQCEYINLILNYNNIHTTYFTVSGYYDFNFDGRRKTTDVNIKVRFRYSLFWIKPKHCKWHSIDVWQHLVFHRNQSHFQPFDPIWRCGNMSRYIHVDTRGKHHNGRQPMSKTSACLYSSRLTQAQESYYFHTGNLNKYETRSQLMSPLF